MNVPLIILYTLLATVSCAVSPKHSANALVEQVKVRITSYRIANNAATAYLSFTENGWYEDSVGITQLCSIKSVQEGTKDTTFAVTTGYRLVDMRKKWAYEYRTMSDTAALVNKQLITESVVLLGGWNFLPNVDITFDSLRSLTDTTIQGITYARYMVLQSFRGKQTLSEKWVRCDKKKSIFRFNRGLSTHIGCPVVKGTTVTPDGRLPMSSVEIEFVSNAFPDSVRRVFAAWKRNVQQYPVQ